MTTSEGAVGLTDGVGGIGVRQRGGGLDDPRRKVAPGEIPRSRLES